MSCRSASTYQTLRNGASRHRLNTSSQCCASFLRQYYSHAATARATTSAPRRRRPALNPNEAENVTKMTRQLVDGSTKTNSNGYNWRRSLRTEELQLESSLRRAERAKATKSLAPVTRKSRAPSSEKSAFMATEDLPEIGEYNEALEPGTFVETSRNEISTNGIVLGEVYADRTWRLSVIMSSGEIWMPVRGDVTFAIPGVISQDLALRCGSDEATSSPRELKARVSALKKLREVEQAIERKYCQLFQQGIDVHSLIKAPDPEAWTTVTVNEVANAIFTKPDSLSILATHKFLMGQPERFIAHNIYRATQTFHVRPWSHVVEIEKIKEWARTKDSPIISFVQKSRAVIKENKKLYTKTHEEAPKQRKATHTWTEDDKIILNFLLHSLRPWRSTQSDPYTLGQSHILRRIDPQFPLVSDEAVHQLLIDLGVLAPWQDLTILRPELELDLEDEATSARVRAQDKLVKKGFLSKPPAGKPLGPEDFYPSDPLEAIRHDFGDDPVYVIDDANAQELDDGVSIEVIPGEPEARWVHVHIADPGSVLPPTHAFSKQASIQQESAYFLQRSWPLFPRSLMHSPANGLSLGARSSAGKPAPVLTFSAKIDSRGDILDSKVRAGLIRNIQQVNYDRVDMHLTKSLIHRTYPFGGEPLNPKSEPLTAKQEAHLRELSCVSEWLSARRMRDGVFAHSEYRASITEFGSVPSNVTSPTFEPSNFTGFPTLSYAVTSMHDQDSGARNMVAEMMKVACRVASRFCLERNMPIIRRAADRVLAHNSTDFQKILDLRTPNGYVLFHEVLPLIAVNPAATYSLEPKGHFGLGVPEGEGYVRVTSPLRRYADLVAHWQIHRALLGEKPLIDEAQLLALSRQLAITDRLRRQTQGAHETFWQLVFIKRWTEKVQSGVIQPEVNPLDDLEAHTLLIPRNNIHSRTWQTEVHVPKLGSRALLTGLSSSAIPPATTLPVKIFGVRLGTMPRLQVELRQ